MSRSAKSPPAEGTWIETIHSAISSTSGAVHRAVSAVAGHAQEAEPKGTTHESTTISGDAAGTTDSGATTTAPAPITNDTPSAASNDATTSSPSKPAAPQPGQSAYPTLTNKPSHISTDRSDPSPSGPETGGIDSQTISKDPSSSLPPPQTSAPESSSGDAPDKTDGSRSEQRQDNKGESIGSSSDSKLRLKGGQDSGSVSMSGQETSHPGAGTTPAAGTRAAGGDPSSGQAPEMGKEGGSNPSNEPTPKSKEDAEDAGTGKHYVKTSGVAAQGGDFDASKPGAGVPKPFACDLMC